MAFSTSASAQDGSEAVTARTPASAQKFLAARLPDHLTVSTNIVYNPDGSYRSKPVNYRAIAAASPDACTTVYTTQNIGSGAEETIRVDWSKTDKVGEGETTQADNSRYFTAELDMPKQTPPNLSIGYDLKEIRDRVLAAAKYLKSACDKTADTGF